MSSLDDAAKDYAYKRARWKRKLLWGIAAFDSKRSKFAFGFVCAFVFVAFSYVIIPWFVAQVHS